MAETLQSEPAAPDLLARERPQRDAVLPLAGVCGVLALAIATLGTWHLDVHSMEGIIAMGGEHMFRTGEWFVPKLYGANYAYKPALAYWLTGASQQILGRTEFALRLPTEICSVALCLFVFAIISRLATPRSGLYAGLATFASALFIQNSRSAGFEIPLALGLALSILAAARNLALRQPSLAWWLLAYVGLVIGFLAKGLPVFGMFGPGLLIAALALRQFRRLVAWQHLLSAALAALAIGLYLYLAYRKEGLVAFQDQWSEISQRSAAWDAARIFHSLLKPLIIWAVLLPSSVLPLFLLAPARPKTPSRLRRMPLRVRRLAIALACFLLAGVVIWTLIPTDVNHYYIALAAPVAALAGLAAERLSPNAFRRDACRRHAAIAPCVAPLAMGGMGKRSRTRRSLLVADEATGSQTTGKLRPAVPGSTLAHATQAARPKCRVAELARIVWADHKPGVILVLAALPYWIIYATLSQPGKATARSERLIAATFAQHLDPQQKVYIDTFDSDSSLFYYLAHPVGKWNLNGRPVAKSFPLVLVEGQESELLARPDLQVEILERCRTKEGRSVLLARVSASNAGLSERAEAPSPEIPSIYQLPPWRRPEARKARELERAR